MAVGFLMRGLLLPCRWPSSHYVLAWLFISVYAAERSLSPASPNKGTNSMGLGPTFITSFNLNPPPESPISK